MYKYKANMYTAKWSGSENKIFKDAFYLRTKIFVEEQGFRDEADELDSSADHLVIYNGEKPAATGRVIYNDDGNAKTGRICVLPDLRGTGLGRLVIEEIEKHCREKSVRKIFLGSQLHARGFYSCLGFVEYGEIYLEENHEHIGMFKKLCD
jgi:predicted GNAT family N-acyltransferase